MSLRTPLGRVRGLGSAKEGVSHWWWQRLSAVALVPLTSWFVFCIVTLAGANHTEVTLWIQFPINSALLILFVVVALHHAQTGMEVVWDDYVKTEWLRLVVIIGTKFLAALLGVVTVVAVLRVALGSG